MINRLVDTLVNAYVKYEIKKIKRHSNMSSDSILPAYVTKRRIKIYNNGKIVFDSNDFDEIPDGIKYTIKSYGVPKNIKPNNKTPLIYKVNTTLSSMFPNEEIETECINSLNKIVT